MIPDFPKQSHDDGIGWLLEPENPSVRYFALRTLLDLSDQEKKANAAKRAIMNEGPVPAILALQQPEGWWGRPDVTYKPPMYRGTVWQIMFLAELDADPAHEQIRRGCEFVLNSMQTERGDFPPRGVQYHKFCPEDMLCYDGMTTWALMRLGYADDSRLERAVGFISRTINESAFRCHFNAGLPCAWGAVKALRALAEVPGSKRSTEGVKAIQAAVDLILDGDLARAAYPTKPKGGVSRQWFRFGFPRGYQSDILQALEVLTKLGFSQDERLQEALAFLASKRRADGRWRLDETPKLMLVPLEARAQPSKWITLKALQVLRRAQDSAESLRVIS